MSYETIKNEVFRFLKSESPEGLAIKGHWGVGKTYTWKKLIEEAKNNNRVTNTKYSYVSLFGINSIESFKFSIFENLVSKDMIGTEPNIETLKDNWSGVSSVFGKKLIKLASDLPVINKYLPTIESVSFLAVSDALICVDDFERKGDKLKPKDILGVLSELKERKNCKIVLILNDESFDDSDLLEQYEKYKEKVIDIELLFAPSASESVNIVLPKRQPNILEKLRKHIVTLKINNIRIIKKIERLAGILKEKLSPYEEELLNQALHTLVLFTWISNAKGEHVPTEDYVKNIRAKLFAFDKEEQTDEEKLWKSILSEYEYLATDEFDLEIAKIVKTGYVDDIMLEKEAERQNQRIIANKSDSSFGEAWRLYHDSFDNNEEEVLTAISTSLKENTKYISPVYLNGTVKLFRVLGKGKEADELIEHYIEKRKEETKLFDLEDYAFPGEIDDKKIQQKFDEVWKGSAKERTLREALGAIAGKDSLGGENADTLAKASVEDYYDLFKSEKGRHLEVWVNTCLKFGRYVNADLRDKQIGTKATEALQRIALESDINARRVAKFGIKPSEKITEQVEK